MGARTGSSRASSVASSDSYPPSIPYSPPHSPRSALTASSIREPARPSPAATHPRSFLAVPWAANAPETPTSPLSSAVGPSRWDLLGLNGPGSRALSDVSAAVPETPAEQRQPRASAFGGSDATYATLGSGQGLLDTGKEQMPPAGTGLKRKMHSRHITMISIGGVIGTGLFLGIANSLREGGPVATFIAYVFMGSIVWSVMISLGELISHQPLAGGHIALAARYVDRSFSFAVGWVYWFTWVIALPAELAASAVIIQYWTDLDVAIWISMCYVVVLGINFAGTRVFAECEYWFALLKVITVIGLILCGILIDVGVSPTGDMVGFRYWLDPGPFVQFGGVEGATGQFLAFWAVVAQAAFSFVGTEITAIAAGESRNPRKTLPRATKLVVYRLLLFYCGGSFVASLLVPSSDPRLDLDSGNAASSPFVIAIEDAGIKVLPHIINGALLSSAWSASSSDLYTSSRALYGLAATGSAPRWLLKVTNNGLPVYCVSICGLFGVLAYMSGGVAEAGTVFRWLASMASSCGLLTWAAIAFIYLRFFWAAQVQGVDRALLPYKSPWQPWPALYALVLCCTILITQGFYLFMNAFQPFMVESFVVAYLPIALVGLMYVSHKFATGSKMSELVVLDLFSGSVASDDDAGAAAVEKGRRSKARDCVASILRMVV